MDIQANQSEGGVFPKFYVRAVENKQASQKEGRPIFRDVEWVDIHIAGDNKTVVSKKVTDEHKNRWPKHYAAFEAGKAEVHDGTPIDQWPQLSVSQVAELKALHIHTVEALAEVSDSGIQNIGMGGRELVAKAKAFIAAASDSAEIGRLASDNLKLKDEIEMLKQQIKEMGEKRDS